jgi:hypothetical protein
VSGYDAGAAREFGVLLVLLTALLVPVTVVAAELTARVAHWLRCGCGKRHRAW